MFGSRVAGTIAGGTALAVILLCGAPAQAQGLQGGAQPPTAAVVTTPGGYSVWFPVDKLGAAGSGPTGIVIKGHLDTARMGLMRPRTQFVTEMLKAVENL
jgi:hypothetical protein